MTKNEMRTLLEYTKTEIKNLVSSNNLTEKEMLFFWSELTRVCSIETTCLAFDNTFDKREEILRKD